MSQIYYLLRKWLIILINEANPQDFALISDLTSFVQLGDILLRQGAMIAIAEVKEGEKNIQALDILEQTLAQDQQIDKEKLEKIHGSHLAKQVERVFRQYVKGTRATEIINKGEGPDPKTGIPIKVEDYPYPVMSYVPELAKLLTELDEKVLAYTAFEDCLIVGAYRDQAKLVGEFIIQELMKVFSGKSFPVVSLRQGLSVPISVPIFLRPFREKDIFDIVFDRVRVYISLNFDRVIEMFNDSAAEARWLSKKETAKFKQSSEIEDIATFENQGIIIRLGEFEMMLGGGFVTRILFNGELPSSVILMNLAHLYELNSNTNSDYN